MTTKTRKREGTQKAPTGKVVMKKPAGDPEEDARTVVWQCKIGEASEFHGETWCDYLPKYQTAMEEWWRAGGSDRLALEGGYFVELLKDQQCIIQVGAFGARRLVRRMRAFGTRRLLRPPRDGE